jgi:ribosome-associated toxin RatA of RatAB toxin-antitoxin module
MPQASRSIVINVTPQQLMSVIADYEKYPQFLPEVKKISVANRTENSAEVTYEIEVIKRISYTLRIASEATTSKWSLIRGDLFKKNEGSWVLRPEGEGKTHATYNLEVEIGGFIPGLKMITDKLTASQLPTLLENFKKRAEALYPPGAKA